MCEPFGQIECFALRALLKKCMFFIDELFRCILLLFTKCPSILNTRSLAALVDIMQNVFLASLLRAGNSNLWSRHHWECRYTLVLVPQALCSIEFLAHVTFTCIGSAFSYPYKEFLISRPPRTPTHNPANAGSRNPRGLTRPAQDSSLRYSTFLLKQGLADFQQIAHK